MVKKTQSEFFVFSFEKKLSIKEEEKPNRRFHQVML